MFNAMEKKITKTNDRTVTREVRGMFDDGLSIWESSSLSLEVARSGSANASSFVMVS
jgi:hypothetical protein